MEGQQKLKWLLCGIALFYFVNWTLQYGLFRYLESGGVFWLALKESTQRSLPSIIFLFEPWKRHQTFEKHKNLLNYTLLFLVVIVIGAFFVQINNHWRITAIIEWATLGFVLLYLYDYKIQNWFFSLYLAFQSVILAGAYYEWPLFPHMTRYPLIGHTLVSLRFPCIIGTAFLSLPLLIHGLTYLQFQTKKPIIITTLFYAVFSVAWTLTPNPFEAVPYWFMRLPMMLVLLSIPFCLKGNKPND